MKLGVKASFVCLEVGILPVSWIINLYLLLQDYNECENCEDYVKESMLASGYISFFESANEMQI